MIGLAELRKKNKKFGIVNFKCKPELLGSSNFNIIFFRNLLPIGRASIIKNIRSKFLV